MWIWLIFQPANRSYNNWQPTARSCCLRGWSLPSPSASGDTAKALPIAGPSMEIKMACQVGSRFSPIGCCFGITKIGIFFGGKITMIKMSFFLGGGRGEKNQHGDWMLDLWGRMFHGHPWPRCPGGPFRIQCRGDLRSRWFSEVGTLGAGRQRTGELGEKKCEIHD